ncbi:SCO family protein [Roseiconus lacunae]|uniref:SCO family protein n=1 Tax=Roseiconus lacunae TaxID=2605694 RepID=UPI001E340A46|nr:SCO family protein [Roseiconus lacunae]MCD0463203.1 SCO family protein [Roseiconus lacunae]
MRVAGFNPIAILAIVLHLCAGTTGLTPSASAQGAFGDSSDVNLNDGLPREAEGITVDQNLGQQVPLSLPLIDSNGKSLKVGDVIDGTVPTIVTMNYSNCPMLCSVQLNQLTSSLNQLKLKLGEDFRILTVSIDPTESTERAAETKAKYVDEILNQPLANRGWTFATAKQPVITKLADVLGFRYRYDESIQQYNHPAMLAFVSPEGVITRYSLALNFPADQLRLALVEAGEGTVGNAVDQFIMWCYSYDPDSNSYTPQAWRIMRLCGAGFIGVMLAALVPYWVGRKGGPQSDAAGATDSDAEGSPSVVPHSNEQ